MEYTGLLQKYPVNRVLTEEERRLQLKQKQRLDVEPAYQLSVIRMNSTFMEVVDKYYGWKGMLTTACLAFMTLICGGLLFVSIESVAEVLAGRLPPNTSAAQQWANVAGFIVVGMLFFLAGRWLLRKESFTYTHYPIRLNRKTRMVHVFRSDGSVLSVPWDHVFFSLGRCYQPRHWEIQGHVLDNDRVTVMETFAFSEWGVGDADREQLRRYWEFVRRYMEEGPAAVASEVKYCLPIETHRESFKFGFHRAHFLVGAAPLPMQALMLMIYVISYPGRWLAMCTSKLPTWPKHIEGACQIEPDDPYIKDAGINPPDLR